MAALALLVTLFLPWYQKSIAVGNAIVDDNLSAFSVFSFVEAAVLLVALGVFLLLYTRSERKGFHLPGGDGTVIFAAGLWAAVLLVWRVFDRPDVEGRGATVGITWGFFFAFLACAALAIAGWRIRAARVPEPANPMADPLPEPSPRRERRPRDRRPLADPPTEATAYLPREQATDLAVTEVPAFEPRADEAPTRRLPPPPADEPRRSEPATDEWIDPPPRPRSQRRRPD
jgi:hypothetical protein